MPERAVRRPPWYAWALLWLAALVLLDEVSPRRLEGHGLILAPVVVLVAVLIVRKLWELPPAPTMCAAIALSVFAGSWRLIGLGGFPLDRFLVLVVVLQFLLRAPGIAHTPRPQIRNVHLLMCLTIMYAVASAVAAGTLTNELGFLSLVDELGAAPYLMFLVAPAVFAGERERNLLLTTLVGVGLYLGFTAIFESFGPHSLVFPRYILNVDTELPGERAGGPFQSSLVEGFATYACAVAAVMALVKWRGLRRRYVAALAAVVSIAGAFVTLERGVWIAAVVATVVTALATQAGRRWLIPGALACALAIGAALVISPALSQKTSNRVTDQTSVWDRENQTSAGLRMVAAKPLFGFGWDRYRSDSLEYFRQAANYPMNGYVATVVAGAPANVFPLHDTYLAYAVELGLVGWLLWLTSLLWGVGGAVFRRGPVALRPWKLGLIAITVFFMVVSVINPYSQTFPPLLIWVWAGLAWGCAPMPARERRVRMPASTTSQIAWHPA
jgi:putative inorganic carbon (hco3(-)) transporter